MRSEYLIENPAKTVPDLLMPSRKKKYTYEYPRPNLTVDLVLITTERRPRILLIRRKDDPYAGYWAFPGGFVAENEPLEAAARRELKEETGIEVTKLMQLGAFGDPGRDPRGWTVTVAFLGRVNAKKLKPQAGDDATAVAWHFLDAPPPLAFDHAKILAMAEGRPSRRS
jgi:8-oxo-dGTP diphosphatase